MEKKKIRKNPDKENEKEIEVEVEILPPGICEGAIETLIEKHFFSRTTGLAAFYKKNNKGG